MVMFNTFHIIIWTVDYIIVESWHSGDVNFFGAFRAGGAHFCYNFMAKKPD